MAITTLDGMVAGFIAPQFFIKSATALEAAGVMQSLFYMVGRPGAAAVPSPGVNGAALTTYAGQIPFSNPGAGNTYLTRFSGLSSIVGTIILADRLWHNSGLTVTTTTEQAITSGAMPARDNNGSANGDGLLCGIEVSTATTNGAAVTNTTLNYTDSDGNAGNTGTIPSTMPGGGFPATAVAGTFVPFQLAAGDRGIRTIEGVTLGTSYGAGAIHLVVYRVLAVGTVGAVTVGFDLDAFSLGMPRLFDNTVPFLIYVPNTTGSPNFFGQVSYAQG